jgi:hypothetical protein
MQDCDEKDLAKQGIKYELDESKFLKKERSEKLLLRNRDREKN